MNEIVDDFELINEELSEYINKPPSWWEKLGLYLLLFVFLLIIFFSIVIKYPDKIIAPIIITSINPPVKIYSEVDGFIDKLYVVDNQKVNKNQLLGVIKSSCSYYDILFVDSLLESVDNDYIYFKKILFEKKLILGELQTYYVELEKAIENYLNFISLSPYPKKIKAKNDEYQKFIKYLDNLKKQHVIYSNSYMVTYSKFRRDSILRINNVISEVDFEISKNNLIEKEYELSKIEVDISSGIVALEKIKQEIIDLQLQYEEKLKDYLIEIENSKNILKAAIAEWKKKYLFISPINGIVSFTRYWHENQYIFKNDLILTIIPTNPNLLIGRVKVKPVGLGKVSHGMCVFVKLDNYPYHEFGSIKGYISNISVVPVDNEYIIEVRFPDGLKTNYNKQILFNQEMPGIAEIITEKKSLFVRILSPIKYLLKYQKKL